MITDSRSSTSIEEIEDGIYRISVPVPEADFQFNQFLIVDEEPLLFHTGMRAHFPLVSEAIRAVMPLERLRGVAFSHYEADECGALNLFLAAAPDAVPMASRVAVLTSLTDFADRAPRALGDGERLSIGRRTVQWIDAPHLPHGWETGYLFESTTRTLFCGDLFTHGGAKAAPLMDTDLLVPAEEFRTGFSQMTGFPDSYAVTRDARTNIEKLAATNPRTLAVMHGSSWRGREGEGAQLLRRLGETVAA
ncbi:MAG TPA: MBL fold metallo-hydrolase [Thermoanaerobaculia bacterium]|nr:MBL fold metallo-hydrolase [Thermoanaerobaculia bacterium]